MSPTRTYLRGAIAGAVAVVVARNLVQLTGELQAGAVALAAIRAAGADVTARATVRDAEQIARRAAAMRRHPSSGGAA